MATHDGKSRKKTKEKKNGVVTDDGVNLHENELSDAHNAPNNWTFSIHTLIDFVYC